jgi:hypothetical protein
MLNAPSRETELAVLLGIPQAGERAMHNDVALMYDALRQRQLAPEQILCLEGRLDRGLVLDFLAAAGRHIAPWPAGHLFLYVSAHGYATLDSRLRTRVGVALAGHEQTPEGNHVYWDEMLAALAVPPRVRLTLLPDH